MEKTSIPKYCRRASKILCIVSVLLIGTLLGSCTTKAAKRTEKFSKSFDEGDYPATIDNIKQNKKDLYGETNAFLYYMDLGVLYHYIAAYDSSNVYLQKAAEIYDDLFTKSVTNEAASLLTNDNVRPYRAKPYELVFLHQLAALNFMARGMFQESLVETRKVQLNLNEWERTSGKDGKKYHSDGMFHLFSSLAYEEIGESDNSLISLYKAVEAYKTGPVPLPIEVRGFAFDRFNAGDREEDAKRLEISKNDAANKWDAKMGQPEIIVVGYAGKSPNLVEQKWTGTYVNPGLLVLTSSEKSPDGKKAVITLPAPAVSGAKAGNTFHISVSLPKVKTFEPKTGYFSAQTGGKDFKSVPINNIDKQAQKALDDAMAEIITRMVIRVVTRTIATQQVKDRTDTGDPLLNLVKNVGTDVAASQLEKADTRMCLFMPQSVHMVRIPVEPGKHTVSLNVYDKNGSVIGKQEFKDVEVGRGDKKVLFHNSLR